MLKLLIPGLLPLLCSAGDLVANGSFEDAAAHWNSGTYLSGAVSSDRSCDGKAAALLEGDGEPKFRALMQNLDLKKCGNAKLLRCSANFFIESFEAGMVYPLYFQITHGKGVDYVHRIVYPGKGTGSWQRAECWIDLGKYDVVRGIRAMVLASPKFKGKIFFDNVQVEPYDALQVPVVCVPKSGTGGVRINHFMEPENGDFASEKSEVQIRHDGKTLFFDCVMKAYALDPVSNQLQHFQAKQTGRDAHVWLDDSIEIRLERRRSGHAEELYYFGLNAAGALCDMKRVAGGTFDAAWNPAVTWSARKGNGEYVAELAVPLSELGWNPADPDARWRLSVVRFDQRLKKTYANAMLGDIQKLDHAPEIRLLDHEFSFELPDVNREMLAAGAIPFRSDATNWSAIALRNGVPEHATSGQGATVKLPRPLPGGVLQLEFRDPDGALRWRSAPYPYSQEHTASGYAVSGAKQLWINGAPAELKGTFLPQVGANCFVALGQGGEVFRGTIDGIADGAWKYCAGNVAAYRDAEFDDGAWRTLPGDGVIPGQGEVTLRKTVLSQSTALLPTLPDRVWRLSENGAYQLLWPGGAYASGVLPKRSLRNFSLELEYPPQQLELLGVGRAADTAYYIRKEDQPHYRIEPLGPGRCRIHVEGKPVALSGTPADWLKALNRAYFGCRLVFRAVGKSGATGELRIAARAEDGTIQELPRTINFAILPELNAPRLKRMMVKTYTDMPRFEDARLNTALLDTVARSGITDLVIRSGAFPHPDSLRLTAFFSPASRFFDKELFEQFPELHSRPGVLLNPSVLTRNASKTQPFLDRAVGRLVAEWPWMDYLWFDYEAAPLPGKDGKFRLYSCHGKTAFAAFAAAYNITEPLSDEAVAGKYRAQWIEFTSQEVGNMLRMIQKAAAKHGKKLVVYSGYQSPETREHYNIDWRSFADAVEIGECGYGHDESLIAATREALGGKPLVTGLLKTGLAVQSDNAAAMFRKAVAGGGGVLLWFENMKDASVYSEAALCVEALAACETLVADGERADALVQTGREFQNGIAVFRRGKEAVVTLFNENNRDWIVPLTTPGFLGRLKENGSERTYDAAAGFSVKVPAGKIVVLSGQVR